MNADSFNPELLDYLAETLANTNGLDEITETFYCMRGNPKYRPTVKKLAKQGDAKACKVMVLWDAHVKEMRRIHSRRG